VRTGDTTQAERAAMLRTPPHILVTTPESLYLLLTAGRSREMLRGVRTVIVDEIHAVIGGRRGAHLALTLERLASVAERPLQRIGLSATQTPIEAVARFLTAGDPAGPPAKRVYKANSHDTESLGRPAKVVIDAKANEAYVADGYLNKRVAVLDADTGKMKRYWGAYGNKPDDTPLGAYDPAAPPAQQFRNPVHCADMSVDRFVYVCDRVGDRLQVFTPEGKFVKEEFYEKNTKNAGSVWDVAFSRDPQQRYIFMADGVNEKVKIIDRQSLKEITTFGDGGRQPGQFYGVHSIATDKAGNVYTTETYEGKRLQRFVNKGIARVQPSQGVPWPRS